MMVCAIGDCAPVAITRQLGEGVVIASAREGASIGETLSMKRPPKNAERLLAAVRGLEANGGGGMPFPLTCVYGQPQGKITGLSKTNIRTCWDKLNGLIEKCSRHPFKGTSKPEPLSGNRS